MKDPNELINISPDIMWGTPVIRGTRVPVKALFDYLGKGHSVDEFLDDFPTVEKSQAVALLELASSELLSHLKRHENPAR